MLRGALPGVQSLRLNAVTAFMAGRSCRWVSTGSFSQMKELIKAHTAHDTIDGIKLSLLTSSTELYYCNDESKLPFPEPWWAFLWPGGRALTKFVVKNPMFVANKRVLDIGSGCGSASIACLQAGASTVVANDIDPMAGAALQLNLELNHLDHINAISFITDNLIHQPQEYFQQYDVVLCGDMLYDSQCSSFLVNALATHPCVVFGDVGRTYCPSVDTLVDTTPAGAGTHSSISDNSTSGSCLLASYTYQEDGFPYMFVFRLTPELIVANKTLWSSP